ncbi:unnamed protein product [Ixodes pacificus]
MLQTLGTGCLFRVPVSYTRVFSPLRLGLETISSRTFLYCPVKSACHIAGSIIDCSISSPSSNTINHSLPHERCERDCAMLNRRALLRRFIQRPHGPCRSFLRVSRNKAFRPSKCFFFFFFYVGAKLYEFGNH